MSRESSNLSGKIDGRPSRTLAALPALAPNRLIATRRARRWHRIVAVLAFGALAWPSLGPLPWLANAIVPHVHASVHAHDADAYRHIDASAIPGSPTHPVDHNCAECQVLKHLARCILAIPGIDFTPSAARCAIATRVAVAWPPTQAETLLPPVRAPPIARA